jgi:hypothetical protein
MAATLDANIVYPSVMISKEEKKKESLEREGKKIALFRRSLERSYNLTIGQSSVTWITTLAADSDRNTRHWTFSKVPPYEVTRMKSCLLRIKNDQ